MIIYMDYTETSKYLQEIQSTLNFCIFLPSHVWKVSPRQPFGLSQQSKHQTVAEDMNLNKGVFP